MKLRTGDKRTTPEETEARANENASKPGADEAAVADEAGRRDDSGVRVRVLLFGAAREAATDEAVLKLARGSNARDAFELLLDEYPDLERLRPALLVAVNQEYARDLGVELKDGDELAVFPPVSGGAEAGERRGEGAQDFFELTTEPIDVGAVARRVVPRRCGASVTLDGYAREWTKGRRTLHLIYEAYAPMALAEMRRLGAEAHRRFDIEHIGIVHRTGRTDIGETSVVITASAPHRRAAFEACEWAIRELKRTVPIWKKEFFEDGSVWVEGEGAPGGERGLTAEDEKV
jgi:molybdopterin synthase catalytic subunit